MPIFSGIFSSKKKQKKPLAPPEPPVAPETSAEEELRRIQAESEEKIRAIEEEKLKEAHEAQELLKKEDEIRMRELEEVKRRETEEEEQKIRQMSEAQIHELEEKKAIETREAQEQLKNQAEARMRELEEAKRREAEAEEEHIREMARLKIQEIEEMRRHAELLAKQKAEEAARRLQDEALRKRAEEEAEKKAAEDARRAAEELVAEKRVKAAAAKNPPASPAPEDISKEKEQDGKQSIPVTGTSASAPGAKATPRFLEKIQRVSEAGELLAARDAQKSPKEVSQKENESTGATSFLDRLKKIRDAGRPQPDVKKKMDPLPTGNLDLLNIDLFRTQSEIVVFAQLPGVDMEDLMIFAEKENDVIVIRAKQKRPQGFTSPSKDGTSKFIQEECSWGSLYRQITLPEEVDILESWARLDKGVLILKLPLLRVRRANNEKKQIKIIENE